MQEVVSLMEVVLKALNDMGSTRKVVGEPLEVHGHTIIPLCKVTVGFAGGGGGAAGAGEKSKPTEGRGSGTGGGVKVEPIAILAVTKEGVSLMSVGGRSGVLAQALEAVPGVVDKIQEVAGMKKPGGPKDEDL